MTSIQESRESTCFYRIIVDNAVAQSYTGIRLLNVLIASGVRPILMITYTNHALDHILTSVFDAGITRNIARLGSKHTIYERLKSYSIDTTDFSEGRLNLLDSALSSNYHHLKTVEEEFRDLMEHTIKATVDIPPDPVVS